MGGFIIRPFLPGDLARVELQEAQRAELTPLAVSPLFGELMWRSGPAFTAWLGEVPIACAGLREAQPHHAQAWAYLSGEACRWLAPISKAISSALAVCGYARVDMVVRADFSEARRWAEMFGFEHEGRMRRAGPGAIDMDLYAKVAE